MVRSLNPKAPDHIRHATKVDLGSGAHPKPGFVGLDNGTFEVEPPTEVYSFDLSSGEPWPFADEQVMELHSSHLIEHLPAGNVCAHEFVSYEDTDGKRSKEPGAMRFTRNQDALFWFMDEAWRICAPGALFELRWPALVDLSGETPRWVTTAFIDPTHRRFIPVETLAYFDPRDRANLKVTGYAISCAWGVVQLLQGNIGSGHVENIAILERLPAES